MGMFGLIVATMNKQIRPSYLIWLGVGLFAVAEIFVPRDNGTEVTAIGFISGLVMILAIIVFLAGIAGAITGHFKRHKKEADDE